MNHFRNKFTPELPMLTNPHANTRGFVPEENKPQDRATPSVQAQQWKQSRSIRDAYKYEISRNKAVLFFTIVFRTGTKDKTTEVKHDEFYDRLNFLQLKHAYNRGQKWIHGLCCRERQSAAMEYTLHYHWVLFDNGNYLYSQEAKERFITKAHKAVDFVNRKRIWIDSLQVEDTHRTDPDIDDGKHTIYTYPTKNFEKVWLSQEQAADSIAYLYPDGIVFGNEQLYKPKGF